MEAHNNQLLKRQDVLANAWESMQDKDLGRDEFLKEWMKVRAQLLRQKA